MVATKEGRAGAAPSHRRLGLVTAAGVAATVAHTLFLYYLGGRQHLWLPVAVGTAVVAAGIGLGLLRVEWQRRVGWAGLAVVAALQVSLGQGPLHQVYLAVLAQAAITFVPNGASAMALGAAAWFVQAAVQYYPGYHPSPATMTAMGAELAQYMLWGYLFRTMARALVLEYQDVTNRVARLQAEQETERWRALAITDGLTGLFNHRHFQNTLTEQLLACGEARRPVAVLMFDLDDFKAYNDRYGHMEGDRLLQNFSRGLQTVVPREYLFRYGGEEFAAVLPNCDMGEALRIGDRIRAAARGLNGNRAPVTVSVGVALFPDMGTYRDQLIQCADLALYASKLAGKDRVTLYRSALDTLLGRKDSPDRQLMALGRGLLRLIDAKDGYTAGHSDRVSHLALSIAQEMRLPPVEVSRVAFAAYLHDVGKLEMDRRLLTKRSLLSQEEWEMVKQHPEWGAELVSSFRSGSALADMIRHHHEHWDGGGYPGGLQGEEIPLGARIIAVADCLDVMVRGRPYQPSIPLDQAVSELRRLAGAQFDPAVVRALLRTMGLEAPDAHAPLAARPSVAAVLPE